MFVRSYLQLHTVTWNHVDVVGFEPFISLTLVHRNILDVFQQHTYFLSSPPQASLSAPHSRYVSKFIFTLQLRAQCSKL